MTNNSTTPIQLLLSHIDDLQKELKASKANIEMMNMVQQYWANLCTDLRRSSVSDYVRLEKRAEKAEAEVERLTENAQRIGVNRYEQLKKAEAEVERLRVALKSCYWATITHDGKYTRACDNVATIAINALKTQDK
jgi:hypothetical protein